MGRNEIPIDRRKTGAQQFGSRRSGQSTGIGLQPRVAAAETPVANGNDFHGTLSVARRGIIGSIAAKGPGGNAEARRRVEPLLGPPIRTGEAGEARAIEYRTGLR